MKIQNKNLASKIKNQKVDTQSEPLCLFLDDERNPEDVTWINYPIGTKFHVVRTYQEFVNYFKTNRIPDIISFDHDIADFDESRGINQEKTGYDCVKFFCNEFAETQIPITEFPMCLYHTNNIIGKTNMSSYVQNFREFML